MIRLGLCCIFRTQPIKFRTTTATYLQRCPDRIQYLDNLLYDNAQALQQAITYCSEAGIGAFRINSQLFPAYTHPDVGYTLDDLPSCEEIKTELTECRKLADERTIRLTFHPDQFVILNSPREDVVEKSVADLEYHALMAELVGADVINIHAGGVYGDKEAALSRLEENLSLLSPAARSRLTLENDDKSYTPADLLPLCLKSGVPLCYDVHHHRCLPDSLSVEEATTLSLTTWNREPLFHISSPKEGWKGPKPHRHHDFIDPKDWPTCWNSIPTLTVDVEAKAKEEAVLDLKNFLT